MSEIALQSRCFQRLWNEYPQTRFLFFAVPNGGYRRPVEAMQLKASGTVNGIPDCILLWDGSTYGFEFKFGDGRLSKDQIAVHKAWTIAGIPVFIIYTDEQFWSHIKIIINKNA